MLPAIVADSNHMVDWPFLAGLRPSRLALATHGRAVSRAEVDTPTLAGVTPTGFPSPGDTFNLRLQTLVCQGRTDVSTRRRSGVTQLLAQLKETIASYDLRMYLSGLHSYGKQ
ncbi:hypothetical protein [Paraburkholderia sediminicola]|uniref:hypothetical protein n=1 Tax=Paraburkholderia sediminicola TaxID=458836 RepID=UPI0038B94AD8